MITIQGQPSLFIQDLKGKEYPAIAEVNRKKRVNGQREISLSFYYDEINEDFLHNIEFGWKIFFKGEWYTITGPTYALDGDKFSVGVSAVLSFFVDMNGHYLQDEVEDKSMTPASYFRELFEGTGYSYVIVDPLSANTLNYQANQSKTERFLYGIDRFEAEYTIRGKVAYIYSLAGSDKDIILHEDLNIQDVSVEVDGSGFHTWAKGYGDKDESQEDADYKLETKYESPLIAKYGYIEGPAIRDGNYKHEPALKEALKKQVENSAKISTTVTAVDLTNNGYPEMQLEEGDRLYLHVDRLKLNTQVRVVEIDEMFDWEGNVIDVQYTLGNEGIAERYKTQQYNTLSDFRDITTGRKRLEYNWLPEAVQRASDIINGNLTSYFHYGIGEIIGINTDNPNGYMRFNTDGLGFSRDGGKTYRTAMTYEGIVADAITAGTLRGIVIEGVEIYGAYLQSLNNKNTYWNLETGEMRLENANINIGNGARINFLSVGNRIQFRSTDDGITRSAGFGVGRALTGYPFAYSGTTGAPDLDTLSEYYSGAMWQTTKAISEGAANGIYGYRFAFRNRAVGWDKGLTYDFFNNPTIAPINGHEYNYSLGEPYSRFRRMYTDYLIGDSIWFSYHGTGSQLGYRMEMTVGQSQGNPAFRPQYGDTNYYNLGTSVHVWRYGYINNVISDSSHVVKQNIEDFDGKLAVDFVDLTNIYTYNYLSDDITNKYEKKVGLIIEQLDPANAEIILGGQGNVNTNNIIYMNQLALKETRKELAKHQEDTELLLSVLIEEYEEIKNQLEELVNGPTVE